MSQSFTKNIKAELEKASEKYHILGAWIAIIFDPVFAVTDYINIPDDWLKVLVIRVSISVITLLILLARKKKNIPSYLIVLIPFFSIKTKRSQQKT